MTMEREPGEAFVYCIDCNGYICAEEGGKDRLVKCPYQCETIAGRTYMTIPMSACRGRW